MKMDKPIMMIIMNTAKILFMFALIMCICGTVQATNQEKVKDIKLMFVGSGGAEPQQYIPGGV